MQTQYKEPHGTWTIYESSNVQSSEEGSKNIMLRTKGFRVKAHYGGATLGKKMFFLGV